MLNNSFLIFILIFSFSLPTEAQETVNNKIAFRIEKINPPISLSRTQLAEAETLQDLNDFFKDNWVKTYIQTKITAEVNGQKETLTSDLSTISPSQKELMLKADSGSKLHAYIEYIPDNNLSHNDPKHDSFTFVLEPDRDATYKGGQQSLKNYIQKEGIDQLANCVFSDNTLAAVQFTINDTGELTNVSLYESSDDPSTDEALLKLISNMGDWSPAMYQDGTTADQEYILSVGNINSCLLNLVQIRK